jgi:hypothetical protein
MNPQERVTELTQKMLRRKLTPQLPRLATMIAPSPEALIYLNTSATCVQFR